MWTQKELEALKLKEVKNKESWKLSASHNSKDLKRAVDKKTDSRYSTNKKMTPGMWLQVELPSPVNLERIVMELEKSPRDFPAQYTVSFSLDGKTWQTSPTQKGTPSVTTFFTPTTKARFIRIEQLGESKSYFWSIHELRLFGS